MQTTTLGAYGGPVAFETYGAQMANVMSFQLRLPSAVAPDFAPVYPSQKCQQNDQGVAVVAQVLDSNGVAVNLRAAAGIKLITVRPSGKVVEVAASFYTNGLDGQVYYSTSASVPYATGLDEAGTWSLQAKFTLAGKTLYTTVGQFQVLGNLGV